MKSDVSTRGLEELQRLIDRSVATAGPSAARSIAWSQRQMTATELVEFWNATPLVAMTTVSPSGRPHSAPVHARLLGARLSLVIYTDTVRRRDLRTNPRVSFTTWGPGGAAVIAYGRASEVADSVRAARPAQDGSEREVVEVVVEIDRIYAMGPRPTNDETPQPRDTGSVKAP